MITEISEILMMEIRVTITVMTATTITEIMVMTTAITMMIRESMAMVPAIQTEIQIVVPVTTKARRLTVMGTVEAELLITVNQMAAKPERLFLLRFPMQMCRMLQIQKQKQVPDRVTVKPR